MSTDRLRNPWARGSVQALIVLALIVIAWQVRSVSQRADDNERTATAVNAILAQSCGAASFEELRGRGLVEECRLAQDGSLTKAIPDKKLPSADADPGDVDPDVVDDDDSSTPADLLPPATPAEVAVGRSVANYMTRNPLSVQPGYERAIARATATYLSANPPAKGRPPTTAEIQDAVRAALEANPPVPGTNGVNGTDGASGANGVSVTSTALAGCDLVFSYSDGSTAKVGPICGANGEPGPAPTDKQIAQAVAAYCEGNGACRGERGPAGVVQTTDSCESVPGRYVSNVDISGPSGDPATLTLTCETLPLPAAPVDPTPPVDPTGEPSNSL